MLQIKSGTADSSVRNTRTYVGRSAKSGPWILDKTLEGKASEGGFQTFVPPADTFGLESLPEAINGILIKCATEPTIWSNDRRLVIDASKSLLTA